MTTDFSIRIRVYVEDTDYSGVVHHPNYFKYMERARTEFLIHQGLPLSQIKDMGYLVLIYKAEIDYLAPARLNDELLITSTVSCIKRTFMDFSHTIKHVEQTEHIYSRGKMRVACVDKHSYRPTRIPSALREILI